jgi:enamine deaminase RidA (YjgF/YER057c/UK114 family)
MTKKALLPPEDSKMFQASRACFQKFGYSPGVVAGGLLFIAGQGGIRPDGTVAESLTEQFQLAMKRTVEILSWEGQTLADLVEIVSYPRRPEEQPAGIPRGKAPFHGEAVSRVVHHRNRCDRAAGVQDRDP